MLGSQTGHRTRQAIPRQVDFEHINQLGQKGQIAAKLRIKPDEQFFQFGKVADAKSSAYPHEVPAE